MKFLLFKRIKQHLPNSHRFMLFISILISLVSLYFDEYHYYSETRRGLGIPLNFFYFIGNKVPSSRLQMFLPENIIRINFRLDIFIINIIILYIIIKLLVKKVDKINGVS